MSKCNSKSSYKRQRQEVKQEPARVAVRVSAISSANRRSD
jgi:hypothetical protein